MAVLIDSNGWFQYFLGSRKAKEVRQLIEGSNERIIISQLNLVEIYSLYLRDAPDEAEEKKNFILARSEVKDVNHNVAILASRLKSKHRLGTADSIILATAQLNNAKLLTSDKDFKGIGGVSFF